VSKRGLVNRRAGPWNRGACLASGEDRVCGVDEAPTCWAIHFPTSEHAPGTHQIGRDPTYRGLTSVRSRYQSQWHYSSTRNRLPNLTLMKYRPPFFTKEYCKGNIPIYLHQFPVPSSCHNLRFWLSLAVASSTACQIYLLHNKYSSQLNMRFTRR
jgi:hypothetical protein